MPTQTGMSRATTAPERPEADDSPWTDRRATAQATRAANARQASGRRRFVDPTTCERDYSAAETEFMQAMQSYKASSGRMFPTWSEVLEVLRSLGYEKLPTTEAPAPAEPAPVEPRRTSRPAPVATSQRLAATG